MHCFMCVMYLMIICSAHPSKDRDNSKKYERRSLFHDVIESLRLRSHLPEEFSNEENNLDQNYEIYLDNESLQRPGDVEFMPRRNDRVEMPTINVRYPKSLNSNETKVNDEIVLYINTPADTIETTTKKLKNTKRPKPPIKNKDIKTKDSGDEEQADDTPFMNSLSGQSQIGNRESQMVVKPTVIVNFRGSVSHRESEIRLERKNTNNDTNNEIPQNIFNIKQEIKLERTDSGLGSTGGVKRVPNKIKQNVKIAAEQGKTNVDEDLMMCETTSWKDNERKDRHVDVLQILVNV